MKFRKTNLLVLSLLFIFFLPGCHDKKPETMREELLAFVHKNHPEKENVDEKTTQIVEKYIHKGMPITKALLIAHKNGVEIKKSSRQWFHIQKNTDGYVGGIDRIHEFYDPINYREVRYS
jgi:hypothetical protein